MTFVQFASSRNLATGSWRVVPSRPLFSLTCDGTTRRATLLDSAGNVQRHWDDPLASLAWAEYFLREFESGIDVIWAGYFSYDLGRLFEDIPTIAVNDLDLPLFNLVLLDRSQPAQQTPPEHRLSTFPLSGGFSRRAYEAAVARCIDFIAAGDVFQVNLSQRFCVGLPAQPLEIFRRLNESAPAAYGAYLDFGDHALISNSPELFLQVTRDKSTGNRHIITRPIKGTRPLFSGADLDLLHSVKDQAELNMIVDLERNDLGRICRIGSIKVTDPRSIEAHPTVYHGVATVEGLLRDDVELVDLLRATFPGGSVTGAAKIRAMQLIEELEPVRRGPYCGAIGYFARNGEIELNVAIRTMIVKGGLVYVPVGGGIVADSIPAAEYEETLVKARAMLSALGMSIEAIHGAGVA